MTRPTFEYEFRAGGRCRRIDGTGQLDGAGDRARRIRLDAHDQHPVRRAREHFARERHSVPRPLGPRDSRLKVELASIAGLTLRAQVDPEVAQCLVSPHDPALDELPIDHLLRFHVPARKQQAPDLGQMPVRPEDVPLMRRPGPQRVLVELDPLSPGVSEHHAREPPVAHRESFVPACGRHRVPEHRIGVQRQSVRLDAHPVGVLVPINHLVAENQLRRPRTFQVACLPVPVPHFQHQPRRPLHIHGLAEGDRCLNLVFRRVDPV